MIVKNIKIENIKIKEHFEYLDDETYEDNDLPNEEEVDYEEDGDVEDHLCYLIRTFLNGNGITTSVERSDLDISVYVFLQRKEKFKNIVKTFDIVINKMKKDILPQYQLEVELYESKEYIPILSFSFYYDENKNKAPF
jgi:hypothetical protein